jgi:hypothetical protein
MNRALLEKPFEPAQIRQRRGRNGVLDYIEGWSVIQRLNDALDGAWSFEITHHEVRGDEVVVLGRLTADGVTKMAFGGSQVTREKESGLPVSLGDDLKAGATDALKKCATFLGVGLHLYAEKPLSGRGPRPAPRGDSRAVAQPAAAAGGNGGPPPASASAVASAASGNGVGGDRATERQLEAILRVARAKGLTPTDVDGMSLRTFGRKPGQLTRAEASSLIKKLSNLTRRTA